MTRVAVTGAGGFIGGHLVASLLEDGYSVVALDRKPIDDWWQVSDARNVTVDIDDLDATNRHLKGCAEVFHLAADMGGIGFITNNDLACTLSVSLATNVIRSALANDVERIVFASSACVYPRRLQGYSPSPLRESDAEPAEPEGGYGWGKLFAEQAFSRLAAATDVSVGLARLFNVYGPHGEFRGGREKAPAANCRKVAQAVALGERSIEVWGDGTQRRSFLYVTDCVRALRQLLASDLNDPVNFASEEVVTSRQLAELVIEIAGHELDCTFDPGAPVGVQARVPDISLARATLGWAPSTSLAEGLRPTYEWVRDELDRGRLSRRPYRRGKGMNLVEIAERLQDVVAATPVHTDGITVTAIDSNPQTDLDLEADRYLKSRLPTIVDAPIMSEEDPQATLGRKGLCWIIDPIDGTINAIAGADDFAVSAALVDAERLETLVGVLCLPRQGRVYRAARGSGSFRDGVPLVGIPALRSPVDRAYRVCAFGVPKDGPAIASTMGSSLANLYTRNWVTRQCGSASIDICRVADGTWSAFFEFGLMYWDIAAANLIAAEAGCAVHTAVRGSVAEGGIPVEYDVVVARNASVLAEVLAATSMNEESV